jgi:hypothetical protein
MRSRRAAEPLRLRGGAEWGQSCDDPTPCVGELQDFGALEQFYSTGDSNQVFRRKLLDLKSQYQVGYRPVKGDGNCFIRGYVFGLLESLLSKPPNEAAGFRGVYGYNKYTLALSQTLHAHSARTHTHTHTTHTYTHILSPPISRS